MSAAELDETNPLAALLAQADSQAPTALDTQLKKLSNGVVDDISNLAADPVIVFDSRSSSTNDAPIGLTVRQPSFVSLGNGQLIPKGSGSMADFKPILEEAVPNTEVAFEEDDESPEVKMIQQLAAKNSKRWKKMGYEPPNDLLKKVRAASTAGRAVVSDIKQTNIGHYSASQNCIPYVLNSPANINRMPALVEEVDNGNKKARKKAPSEGMKLDEAVNQSVEMMREIIEESPQVKEIPLEEIPDEDEVGSDEKTLSENSDSSKEKKQEEKKNGEEEEEEEEARTLYGHLQDIDPKITGPPVYDTLLTGEVYFNNEIRAVTNRLKQILDICVKHLWIEETAYINSLLSIINNKGKTPPKFGFTRKTPRKDMKSLKNKIQKSQDEKLRDIELAGVYRDQCLEKLEKEYSEKAKELDEKYQDPEVLKRFSKPNKELLDLRESAMKLLKQNKIPEATRITARIRRLEGDEQRRLNQMAKDKYHLEDRKLKEEYATARQAVLQRYKTDVSRIEAVYKDKDDILERRVNKLETIIEEGKTAKKIAKKTKVSQPEYGRIPQNLNSEFTEKGTFTIKPPKPLYRSNDNDIISGMTMEMMKSKIPASSVNINTALRNTLSQKKRK